MRRTLTVAGIVGVAWAGAVAGTKALIKRRARRPVPVVSVPDGDHNVYRQLNRAVHQFGETFGS